MDNFQIASLPFLGASLALICIDIQYNYLVNLDIAIWIIFSIIILLNGYAIYRLIKKNGE